MKKNKCMIISLLIISFFLTIGSVSYAEDDKNNVELDISNGWTIEFNSSFPSIDKDSIFVQNHVNQSLNQKMVINNFANIGDAELTATKSIPLKKGYEYKINLIYAMQFKEAQRGWIDFNGDTIYSEIETYPSDKVYTKTIIPEADFTYTITIHYNVKKMENGYLKLGYSMEGKGVEEVPQTMDSSVTVRYISEDGQKIIENEVIKGKVGEMFSIPEKEIDHYTMKEVQGAVSGQFTKDPQEVTFLYSKNKEKFGTVTAYYQDEAGNDLEQPTIKQGLIDETYQIGAREFEGYTLKNITGEQTGAFKPESQSIVYTYEQVKNELSDSTVTIDYQDEQGNVLAEQMIKNGALGQTYSVDIKEIPEYSLKEIKDEHFGKYAVHNQVVRCIYVKNKVTNVVHQTLTENTQKLPLLGENSKRLLLIIGLLILATVLIFYSIREVKKKIINE
ncbi:hypothetical protein DOK67_0000311 [Enterococcus sp. DIV0212c]|uniref:MucBP domain-containing protein n=1 Tax=Enterococcus sp. DIV0212c TaxID=2230867 RepID=UPI001A9AE2D7|nr:MucBP domain-containing protein [Enterococcus sp. DIV0212c]MBO1352863.1 MucBP domain-containing protein [Enterococcus sp. DIV0212c]